MISPLTFSYVPNTNLKEHILPMNIEIEKYRKYKFYDNIEDLSIRYF